MKKREIVYKHVDEIRPYENNPRKNDDAVKAVAESIKEFGFNQPIGIDKDGIVVVGHTRLKAAQRLGLREVPCIVLSDISDEQVAAYRLADNRTAEQSDWDYEALAEELKEIGNIDMSLFGFDEVSEPEVLEVQEDNFEIELSEKPKARAGQIYELGRHRLMCGDSTDIGSVERLTDGNEMDMLITDPPYGVDYSGKTTDALKIANDNLEEDALLDLLTKAFENANDVLRPGGAFYIWHADSKADIFRRACRDAGWTIRQVLIWVKNVFVLGRQDYQWQHEPCLYGWKDGAAHVWTGDRKQSTILEFDRPLKNTEHPTMKPVLLFDYQMQNNTNPGDKVLDLFGGSGTALIAAEQNGRTCYMMEYDPQYADVIIARWEALTGEKAKLIE